MISERSFASTADSAVVPYGYEPTANLRVCDEWGRCTSLTVPARGAGAFGWGLAIGVAATLVAVVVVSR